MSLLDLRKHNTPCENRQKSMLVNGVSDISADDFIEGANRYANGIDNVVSIRAHQAPDLHLVPSANQQNQQKPLRRATFTLSENCISALNHHTNLQGYAKSHLIRIMIQHFDQLSHEEQNHLIQQYKNRDR